ncbi:MAG: 4Fe-4S binding protein [Cytophagales bacterium]|nr:4Fe-4S binding protein [Cytophagales bacterium]MDW8383780.1 4Fe-4S dicluster domain-containing protein [Flammeovirgaceae bacterium]
MKQKGANSTYWHAIKEAWTSCLIGLMLTWKHFRRIFTQKRRLPLNVQSNQYFSQNNGLETLLYPYEKLPIPDNGRYKLHNEIDDCIVCDKCAKICPVDCIEIEPIKAPEIWGYTSDGTPKRIYAAKFNIDMAKCCFCGLCTTVCPTECLTMTKEYEFSEFDVRNMNIAFATMTEAEISEKKRIYELSQQAKEKRIPHPDKTDEASTAQLQDDSFSTSAQAVSHESSVSKPFKPKIKPLHKDQENTNSILQQQNDVSSAQAEEKNSSLQSEKEKAPSQKPMFKPKIKPLPKTDDNSTLS